MARNGKRKGREGMGVDDRGKKYSSLESKPARMLDNHDQKLDRNFFFPLSNPSRKIQRQGREIRQGSAPSFHTPLRLPRQYYFSMLHYICT